LIEIEKLAKTTHTWIEPTCLDSRQCAVGNGVACLSGQILNTAERQTQNLATVSQKLRNGRRGRCWLARHAPQFTSDVEGEYKMVLDSTMQLT
jgi:hypothetical protein